MICPSIVHLGVIVQYTCIYSFLESCGGWLRHATFGKSYRIEMIELGVIRPDVYSCSSLKHTVAEVSAISIFISV